MSMVKNKPEINPFQPAKSTSNAKSARKPEDASFAKPTNQPQNTKRQENDKPKGNGFIPKDKDKVRQMNEL